MFLACPQIRICSAQIRTDPEKLFRDRARSCQVDSATQYKQADSFPGNDAKGALDDLFGRVDDLERFHSQDEGIHEKRLITLMLDRTGQQPSSGTAPVREYQDLLGQLNFRDRNAAGVVEVG